VNGADPTWFCNMECPLSERARGRGPAGTSPR
jgi:hypothetical protein